MNGFNNPVDIKHLSFETLIFDGLLGQRKIMSIFVGARGALMKIIAESKPAT